MNQFYLINLLLLIGYSMFHYIYFKRLTKKQILLSFLPGLIIFTLNVLIFRGINQEIIREIPAIALDNTNEANVTETTIFIKGTLTKRLFLDDDFYGTITLDETHVNHHELMNFHLSESNQNYIGSISKLTSNDIDKNMMTHFYAPKGLTAIAGVINEHITIVGPASTVDEATTIYEEIIDNAFGN